jgi:hypothetical protein
MEINNNIRNELVEDEHRITKVDKGLTIGIITSGNCKQ